MGVCLSSANFVKRAALFTTPDCHLGSAWPLVQLSAFLLTVRDMSRESLTRRKKNFI